MNSAWTPTQGERVISIREINPWVHTDYTGTIQDDGKQLGVVFDATPYVVNFRIRAGENGSVIDAVRPMTKEEVKHNERRINRFARVVRYTLRRALATGVKPSTITQALEDLTNPYD